MCHIIPQAIRSRVLYSNRAITVPLYCCGCHNIQISYCISNSNIFLHKYEYIPSERLFQNTFTFTFAFISSSAYDYYQKSVIFTNALLRIDANFNKTNLHMFQTVSFQRYPTLYSPQTINFDKCPTPYRCQTAIFRSTLLLIAFKLQILRKALFCIDFKLKILRNAILHNSGECTCFTDKLMTIDLLRKVELLY